MKSYCCSECRQAGHTRAACPELIDPNLAKLDRRARYKARMLAVGRCRTCGDKAFRGGRYCQKHRAIENARQRRARLTKLTSPAHA